MNSRARILSIVFGVVGMFAGIAALDMVPDGASASFKFLTASDAIAPWVIVGAIVWAANEIIQAMKTNQ